MQSTDFTQHPDVQQTLSELKAQFSKREFRVSDVLDSEGHQYVNLVQEGGGVLGIALVGYTYILEQMGVRFLSLAGTSAGAINTILISAIGKKQEEKSTVILGHLGNLKLFDFVDGFWLWKFLIRQMSSNTGFFKRLKRTLTRIVVLAVILAAASCTVYFFFPSANPGIFWWLMMTTFLLMAAVIIVAGIMKWLFREFKKTRWGIQPRYNLKK